MKGIVFVTVFLISISVNCQRINVFDIRRPPMGDNVFQPRPPFEIKRFVVKRFKNRRIQSMFKKLKKDIVVTVQNKVIKFRGLCNNCPIDFTNTSHFSDCTHKWCGRLSQVEQYLSNLLKQNKLKFLTNINMKAYTPTGQWVQFSRNYIDELYRPSFEGPMPGSEDEAQEKTTTAMKYSVSYFSDDKVNAAFKRLNKPVIISINEAGQVQLIGLCNNCSGSIYNRRSFRCTKMMCPGGSYEVESHLINILRNSGYKWHPKLGHDKGFIFVGSNPRDMVALGKMY